MFKKLHYVDLHTAGEPVRIVTKGYPELRGASILDKRREAKEKYDTLRRAMNFEPRGHAGMYGVIPVFKEMGRVTERGQILILYFLLARGSSAMDNPEDSNEISSSEIHIL